ncbi:hypothetical protein FAM09_23470 [Niastella caeni]|uniref:Uncharacterized protein n=1 Tax=Niastella caeni TaxID=2569763 RepID=A0A4S8HPL0_9BACT|nr:hypothetical protein [Niastella caeni]THU34952.1 hypothetical protein FAM09_23470 [Niastella caeni]
MNKKNRLASADNIKEQSKIYQALRNQFHQLNEIDAKEIMAFQFPWHDQFAQSIYRSEVKDGTIKLYYNQKAIDQDELWRKRKFTSIIAEWEDYTPKLVFNSIGEYLLFYKSIFQLKYIT